MPTLNNVRVRKPFHESIIDTINEARSNTEMEAIGMLLTTTIIPKGHEAIIAAWTKRCREMSWSTGNISYIEESLMSHKRELEIAMGDGSDSIKIKISLKGQTYEGNLDPEESFVATLMTVQRQGNNKVVDALGYLAELGDNHHMDKRYEISRKNRLGF